jgi:F420-non-reducing hydrogenase iron-sulfur subunit
MNNGFIPKIIGFLCNWCSYAGADLAGVSRLKMPPSLRTIRVMCSSRVNPLFILKALLLGADGVLIAGCHPGDCHYMKGNYFTRRRFAILKTLLKTLNFEPARVRLVWVSASESTKFQQVITEFTEDLKKLGKNKVGEKVFI